MKKRKRGFVRRYILCKQKNLVQQNSNRVQFQIGLRHDSGSDSDFTTLPVSSKVDKLMSDIWSAYGMYEVKDTWKAWRIWKQRKFRKILFGLLGYGTGHMELELEK